jgi:hypothetical protein
MVALWGYQDDLAGRVVAGATERSSATKPTSWSWTNRRAWCGRPTAYWSAWVVIEHLDRLAAMTPYGPVPEDDQFA